MLSLTALSIIAVCFIAASNAQVSSSDKKLIVDLHNKFRSQVNHTAKNMMKMYWSEDIARGAQNFINTCPRGHDSGKSREKGAGLGISIGQNLAWGYRSWESAITGWHDEVKDFRYGYGSVNGRPVGHYTQAVRDHATHIGCGYKYCGGSMPTYYVCNYAYAQMDFKYPYKSGSTCADCPNFCRNKMCDCGNVVCRNGGKMDPKTCKCRCASPWTGKECAQLNCPGSDPSVCGRPGGYQPDYCDIYVNVPQECPYMCGICR